MVYTDRDLARYGEWMPQVRFPNGGNVNLASLSEAIQEQCDENGIPVAFEAHELKVGGLLSKQREDILLMYHPQHRKDYLNFAIRVMHQGKYAFMHVYNLGGSKNYGSFNKEVGGSIVRSLINSVTGMDSKLQEEENYYTILRDCLANVVGV